jgi:hypothetical protein
MVGRYAKLGISDAEIVKGIIDLLPLSDSERIEYKIQFLGEFNNYSDKKRKVGEPENEGCIRELENIAKIDIHNPKHLAKWLKEHQHTKYQKNNVGRERKSFFDNFLD